MSPQCRSGVRKEPITLLNKEASLACPPLRSRREKAGRFLVDAFLPHCARHSTLKKAHNTCVAIAVGYKLVLLRACRHFVEAARSMLPLEIFVVSVSQWI